MEKKTFKRVNRILLVCTLLAGLVAVWMLSRAIGLMLQP